MTRKVNILSGTDLNSFLSTENIIKDNITFKVWPIPNNGSFSILMENDGSDAELKIFDLLGKEIHKQNITGKTKENINLKSKGVYILKISNPDSKKVLHVQKIIVQ
jgi:hypothetical protein